MIEKLKKPVLPTAPKQMTQTKTSQANTEQNDDQPKDDNIVQTIINRVKDFTYLREYKIRDLIQDSQKLGQHLIDQDLKSNQMRKFLDALNRIKVELAKSPDRTFNEDIDWQVISLDYKFTYAAATKKEVTDLSKVVKAALKKVKDTKDFDCLFTFIESTVAYHKEAEAQGKKSKHRR